MRLSRLLVPVLPLFAFLLLASSGQAADTSVVSIEMGDAAELFVTLRSDFDLVEAGRAIPVVAEVWDTHRVPLANVAIHLASSAGRVEPEVAITNEAGRVPFTFYAADVDGEVVVLSAWVETAGFVKGYEEFQVRVMHLPPPPIYARTEVLSLGIASLLLGIFAKTEAGKYALLHVLTFPLYVRLKKEEVLDHFVRGQIYGFIRSNPGTHYSEIRDTLQVANGTLSHHLQTLEVQGFITSMRQGIYRLFYPEDVKLKPKTEGIRLSDLQVKLLSHLKRDENIVQGQLAAEMDVTQQCISYNLRLMCKEGLLERERWGRRVVYRVVGT